MTLQSLAQLRSRLWRRRRRMALVLGIAIVLLGVLWVVLKETPLLRVIVQRAIGQRVEGECTIASLQWNGWDSVEIEGFSIRAKNWPDSASEVLNIDRLQATFDPLPFLWGNADFRAIRANHMLIRAVERGVHDDISLMTLHLPAGRSSGMRPPSVEINDLELEAGRLDEATGKVDSIGSRHFAGRLANDRTRHDRWTLTIEEKQPRSGDPVTLRATLTGADFDYDLTLTNVNFNDSLTRLLPAKQRELWEQLQLSGRIDAISLNGNRWQPLREAVVNVRGIEMHLPDLDTEEGPTWSRYVGGRQAPETEPPVVQVERGTVKIKDWTLSLEDVRGQLISRSHEAGAVPLPVELSFAIDLDAGRTRDWDGEDPGGWFTSALENAPFRMAIEIPRYALQPRPGQPPPLLVLPTLAAEILENFHVQGGGVAIRATVARDGPHWRDGSGPGAGEPLEGPVSSAIKVNGEIVIQDGIGEYHNFPYLLHEVQGRIGFNNDQVDVYRLQGKGSKDCEVVISGRVLDPGNDAGVDLHITTKRGPIDSVLVEAMKYSPAQRFLTLLFCRPAFDSLQAAHLPAKYVEDLRAMFKGRDRAPGAASADGGLAQSASEEIHPDSPSAPTRRFAAIDWLSTFEPGGWCTFSLDIHRDVAGGDRIQTTGTITLFEADALCEPFPYPLHVLGSEMVGTENATITLTDESIKLPVQGLQLRLPGGGLGTVTGRIDTPRGRDGERAPNVIPAVRVHTHDDQINPLLLAAIPTGSPNGSNMGPHDGWPGATLSPAAEIVRDIGLQGELESTIDIVGDGQGGITWRTALSLKNGTAAPDKTTAESLAESGLTWPMDFKLSDCRATGVVDPNRAELRSFEGHRERGTVRATGHASMLDASRDLSVDFDDIGVGDYLVNLFPSKDRRQAEKFWQEHSPSGAFSAKLDWNQERSGARHRTLTLHTDGISFDAFSPGAREESSLKKRVEVAQQGGSITLRNHTIDVKDLVLSVNEQDLPPSRVRLNGSYGTDGSQDLHLTGEWTHARLDSSLLLEALALAGATDAVTQADRFRSAGEFDAVGTFTSDTSTDRYRVNVTPRWFKAVLDGDSAEATFEPQESAIVVRPDGVYFNELHGKTDDGVFVLNGVVPRAPTPDLAARKLGVRFAGSRLGPAEKAFLPRGVKDSIKAIDLACDGEVALRNSYVTFATAGDGSMRRGFEGELSVVNAAFRAGLQFKELTGSAKITVPPDGGATLDIKSERYLAGNFEVTQGGAIVRIHPGGEQVDVERIDGLVGGGRASADARVRFGEERDYSVTASLVGAQLGVMATGLDSDAQPGAERSAVASQLGDVDAAVRISGPLDDRSMRIGRGRVSIADGKMAELPLTLSFLHLTQLMLPLNTSLDRGDVRFHIAGDHLVFERFDLACPTLRFVGKGELNLHTDDLALRFHNHGTLPLVSDLFGVLTDSLYAIDVTGTLSDPKVSVAPLPPINSAPVAAESTPSTVVAGPPTP